jgi:hypothetical protein
VSRGCPGWASPRASVRLWASSRSPDDRETPPPSLLVTPRCNCRRRLPLPPAAAAWPRARRRQESARWFHRTARGGSMRIRCVSQSTGPSDVHGLCHGRTPAHTQQPASAPYQYTRHTRWLAAWVAADLDASVHASQPAASRGGVGGAGRGRDACRGVCACACGWCCCCSAPAMIAEEAEESWWRAAGTGRALTSEGSLSLASLVSVAGASCFSCPLGTAGGECSSRQSSPATLVCAALRISLTSSIVSQDSADGGAGRRGESKVPGHVSRPAGVPRRELPGPHDGPSTASCLERDAAEPAASSSVLCLQWPPVVARDTVMWIDLTAILNSPLGFNHHA